MVPLRHDLPDIADEVIVAAGTDETLREALLDYQFVCVRITDNGVQPEDLDQWVEIRAELIAEIRRLYLGIKHSRGGNLP